MDTKILSICIPTYNRSANLDLTLRSITENEYFDSTIEIVISDNCSTDDTEAIVAKYQKKANNITYHKNADNLGMEANFLNVLSLAKGQYLKLCNDYVIFNRQSLKILLDSVSANISTKPVLFYLNSKLVSPNGIDVINNDNIDGFIKSASYWSTWISCFGIWKQHFDSIIDKKAHIGLMFFHTSLLFNNLLRYKKNVIIETKFFSIEDVNNKGGYNLFEVFVNGYLNGLIKPLYKDGHLAKTTYLQEKSRLLNEFLLPWYYKIARTDQSHGAFTTNNALKVLLGSYPLSWQIYRTILRVFKAKAATYLKRKQLVTTTIP